jgi:predicted MFS family arabinose efflux permease
MDYLIRCRNYFWDDHPVIRLYFLAYALNGFNLATFFIYVPLVLPMLGYESIHGVALLIGIPALTSLVGHNVFGALCLRRDRFRSLLLIGSSTFIPLFFILAFIQDVKVLFVYLAIHGFLLGALYPSSQTLVTLLRSSQKAEILSKLFAYDCVGWGLACLMMGLITGILGTELNVYVRVFIFYIMINSLVFVVLFRTFPKTIRDLDWSKIQSSNLGAYRRILTSPPILCLFVYIFTVETGSTLFFFFFSRYFTEVLSGAQHILGYAMFGATVMGILTFPLVGKIVDRRGYFPVLVFSAVTYLFLFMTLGFIKDPLIAIILYTLPIFPLITVSVNAGIAILTTDSDRGIGFGVLESVFHFATLLSPLVGSTLLTMIELSFLPWFTVVLVLAGVLFLPVMKRVGTTAPDRIQVTWLQEQKTQKEN